VHISYRDNSQLTIILASRDGRRTDFLLTSRAEKSNSLAEQRLYELRNLDETTFASVRRPETFSGPRLALFLSLNVLIVALGNTALARESNDLRSSVLILITAAVSEAFIFYILLYRSTRPRLRRPFIVAHTSKAKRALAPNLAAWSQVVLGFIALLVSAWAIYLVYRPPGR